MVPEFDTVVFSEATSAATDGLADQPKVGCAALDRLGVVKRLGLAKLAMTHEPREDAVRLSPDSDHRAQLVALKSDPRTWLPKESVSGAESGRPRVRHIYTRYTPRTNGKAERFIRTLKEQWAYGTCYQTSARRTRALRPWLNHYNRHRPHAGIGMTPPIARLSGVSS